MASPALTVSKEESDAFVDGAIKELQEDKGTFADNVTQVGKWANQVDEAFSRVTYGFVDLETKYKKDFPQLTKFLSEWKGYKSTWEKLLRNSRDTASKTVVVLRRFDKIFIGMVQEIQTDQDRLDCIVELQNFIKELDANDESVKLSQAFNGLRHDIEDFVVRFDAWIKETGEELARRATELQEEINGLKKIIQDLDEQIKQATVALLMSAAGAATMIGCIGMAVAGSVLAALVIQRIIKAKELSNKKDELEDVNRKQEALAHIKSQFDGLRPDIALICNKLIMFAEIWSSVRSQIVQFEAALHGGMEAVRNMRFKRELRLASELCTPLQAGLERYATELENRK